ncbi:MAG TPA: bifunctional UDP-N-acetylglucosamine diphosphorylase/glucosamine-1-phosphate N-acetyltransferase GlmU, partial [Steroidobacteraceae bacterium]|nr:bifunctional UDP-N-acetylglucosamine diphosphorylase/glucosamine-1-phosphate N-acetyltransferase GlmU [Steroidobacteraceae bacterium]
MSTNINVVILAAGLGTRMKSKRAKVLHQAGGLTLVEHVVNTARELTPADRITVVVGHQADRVQQILSPQGVRFAVQREQKGTGHAVLMARDILPPQADLVLILYGDTPLLSAKTLKALIESQKAGDNAATLITTKLDDPTGYGRVLLDGNDRVQAIVEQKAATPEQLAIQLVNSGIYCFRANLLWKYIDRIGTDNPAHEYYLTDMAEILNRTGHTVAAMEVPDSSELLGINTRVELAEVDRIFRARKVRELMLAGVTVEQPETVTIDAQVEIGMDSIIGPFAQILGRSVLGEDCRVGACSIVRDSRLADRVEVGPFTIIGTSQIEEGAQIGPFARLRADNTVGASAHIGNFVELKKTKFAKGAKANHLAYLGDSEIGEKTNIGAGTITCNYDGVAKHKTVIGDRSFIGSNSTLVAPIEIAADTYIGAGSVITEPVPEGALAIGRGRQVTKEGWVA